jgi:hypothetical protein
VDGIKFIRLELAGNSRTVEEEIVPRRMVNGKFHSTKSVGKPRRRWEDTAHRKAIYVGLRNTRMQGTSRE